MSSETETEPGETEDNISHDSKANRLSSEEYKLNKKGREGGRSVAEESHHTHIPKKKPYKQAI